MNLGLMSYDDGVLTIRNDSDAMHFPITNEDAGAIMRGVRQSYRALNDGMNMPSEMARRIASLSRATGKQEAIERLTLMGYVQTIYTDGITLFVKCQDAKQKLFSFQYVSDVLPDTHGSTHVNITMNI